MSAALIGACATTPEIREIDGPIILDAPDSVVRAEPAQPVASQDIPQADPYPYEDVQSVPVTPITCPSGSSPQPDGSCMLTN